ncbi:MAG: lytic transglycosylase domain-containing protein [Pseudomonadota bacterium]
MSAAPATTGQAEPLPNLLTKNETKAATGYLKKPDAAKARLPKALRTSQYSSHFARLHSWIAVQENRFKSQSPAAYVANAQGLEGLPRELTTQRRMEAALTFTDPADVRLAWFDSAPPVTGKGQLLLADARIVLGASPQSQADLLRTGWRRAWLDFTQEDLFLAQYATLLTPQDHLIRARFLMAYEGYSAARRMLKRLPPKETALLQARLDLRGFQAGVDRSVEAVPADLQSDTSLILDRAYWRRKKNLRDKAIALLTDDLDAMALVRPQRLWRERHFWARRLIKDGDFETAYRLSANHNLKAKDMAGDAAPDKVRIAYAEAEWTAGWLALRFINRPELAYGHFQKVFANVTTPVSRTRGAYWLGRTALALGDEELAKYWLRRAARMPHRYYGRLASEMLDQAPDVLTLTVGDIMPEEADTLYQSLLSQQTVVDIRLLQEAGRDDMAGVFLADLAVKQERPEEVYLLARLGADLGRPDLPLKVAKKLEARGIVYRDAGYPTIALPTQLRSIAPLMHAVARQESAFNPTVVSRAGARGLMQLMPATARRIARENNMKYRFAALTEDPEYNMRLSRHYLDFLGLTFSDAKPLMVAGYNAGENAVARWVKDYGKPSDRGTDAVDWVELIPYSETRNYVQRVLEALVIYEEKMLGQNASSLHSLLGDGRQAGG